MNTLHKQGLPWPPNKPRCLDRKNSQFRGSGKNWGEPPVTEAANRIEHEVSAFTKTGRNWRTTEIVVWSWAPIGVKGRHISARPVSEDPGVVVTFDLDRRIYTIACDRYTTISGNLCAIAAYVNGLRAQERHGVADLGEMLAAHLSLPPSTRREWWQVLGLLGPTNNKDQIKAAYRDLAKRFHPDNGGTNQQMAEINAAYDEATK